FEFCVRLYIIPPIIAANRTASATIPLTNAIFEEDDEEASGAIAAVVRGLGIVVVLDCVVLVSSVSAAAVGDS
ncbi:MAG: hypothetical protein AB8V23_04300, partial [Candidatus Midichloria sp.]